MNSLFEKKNVPYSLVKSELMDNKDINSVDFNQFLTTKDLLEAGKRFVKGMVYCVVANGKNALIEYDTGGVYAVTDAELLSYNSNFALFQIRKNKTRFSVKTSAFLTGEVDVAPATDENIESVYNSYPNLKYGYLYDFDGLEEFEEERTFYEDMLINGLHLND